jgi:D-sedoheptulose 7-phosphate isomerase
LVNSKLSHAEEYFAETGQISERIDYEMIERIAEGLADLRARGGRLFLLGVGGSAANCSHAVNDFRKLCGIEAYTPVDNVAELTARTNDEGWETVFAAWLRVSRASNNDAIFVFSVGGGSAANNISVNIVRAVDEAKRKGLRIYGVVGRDGGYTKQMGDAVLVIPTVNPQRVTPHTEAFHAVAWHCLVSHPKLQLSDTKWESAVAVQPITEKRAVFVDRDGVINRAIVRNGVPYPPTSLGEFEILPGVAEAILQLKNAGFAVIVATNQPDVAKGIQRREVIEAMHSSLMKELAVDEIKVCWDLDSAEGTSYKPKPGMLLAAAKERAINLTRSYMVGDRWRDVGAGRAAGCFTIFIDRGYAEPLRETPDATCADLREAAAIILRHASRG